MKEAPRIRAGQWWVLLLTSRLSHTLLFSLRLEDTFTVTECLLSSLLNGMLVFLLCLPALCVYGRWSVGRYARSLSVTAQKNIGGFFAVLCLFLLCVDHLQFADFASKTMKADFPVTVLAFCVILAGFMAAFFGIQPLARAALPIFLFAVAGLLIILLSLIPEMGVTHFPLPAEGSISRLLRCTLRELPRSAETVLIGMMLPFVKGSRIKACAFYGGGVAVIGAVIGTVTLAVLGDYTVKAAYPFYTATTAAHFGIFQQPGLLTSAIWIGTFFVRFALVALLYLESVRIAFGDKARLPGAVVGVLVTTLFVVWIPNRSYTGDWGGLTIAYWLIFAFFGIVLPCILWGLRKGKAQ